MWAVKPRNYSDNEEQIPFDGQGYGYASAGAIGSGIHKLARVNGKVFAVGSPLRVFERMPDRRWHEHVGIPIPSSLKCGDDARIAKAMADCSFNDIAGFSDTDLYVVGSLGGVWHFDGVTWMQLPFPASLTLCTVTCAENGLVYITDILGSLWQGRHSTWKLLQARVQRLPFADAGWFNGTLWGANDDGMFALEGDRLELAHCLQKDAVSLQIASFSKRIDVAPDGRHMLVCGGQGAALHDGVGWTLLFSGDDFA